MSDPSSNILYKFLDILYISCTDQSYRTISAEALTQLGIFVREVIVDIQRRYRWGCRAQRSLVS